MLIPFSKITILLIINDILSCSANKDAQQVNSLIISQDDINYTQVTHNQNIYNFKNCLAWAATTQEESFLALVYYYISKTCSVITATTSTLNETPQRNYSRSHDHDRILISNLFDNIVFKFKFTVIQQRMNGNVQFNKTWSEYEEGFGDHPDGDFWIGLANIRQLTENGPRRIRFEMWKHDGTMYVAEYSSFQVGPSSDKYRLYIDGYDSGVSTAGDSMNYGTSAYYLNGKQFSTIDNDNDGFPTINCSDYYKSYSGFWFNRCYAAHPNGVWSQTRLFGYKHLLWYTVDGFHALHRIKMLLYN